MSRLARVARHIQPIRFCVGVVERLKTDGGMALSIRYIKCVPSMDGNVYVHKIDYEILKCKYFPIAQKSGGEPGAQ